MKSDRHLVQTVDCDLTKTGFHHGCFQANIYLFKVNNRNTKKRFEIC